MPRNQYEEGWGVIPFEWHAADSFGGVPCDEGVILVEVWETDLRFWEKLKPRAEVLAQLQLWVHRPVTGWHRVMSNGDLSPIAPLPKVRRWARTVGSRSWSGTVILEGWS